MGIGGYQTSPWRMVCREFPYCEREDTRSAIAELRAQAKGLWGKARGRAPSNVDDGEVLGDAGGDGGRAPVAGLARHVLQAAHAVEQVPRRQFLPAVEVRGRAARVREVRVRPLPATHEEDAGGSARADAGHPCHTVGPAQGYRLRFELARLGGLLHCSIINDYVEARAGRQRQYSLTSRGVNGCKESVAG